MKKVFYLFIFCMFSIVSFAQKKVGGYIDFHMNKTIYDRTLFNNPGGVGGNAALMINSKHAVKAIVEFAAEGFGGTELIYFASDGSSIGPKREVYSVMAGSVYEHKNLYVGCSAGPVFLSQGTYGGIKPVVGYYFSKTKRLVGKISLTNVFQRDHAGNKDFGFLGFGIGVKLF